MSPSVSKLFSFTPPPGRVLVSQKRFKRPKWGMWGRIKHVVVSSGLIPEYIYVYVYVCVSGRLSKNIYIYINIYLYTYNSIYRKYSNMSKVMIMSISECFFCQFLVPSVATDCLRFPPHRIFIIIPWAYLTRSSLVFAGEGVYIYNQIWCTNYVFIHYIKSYYIILY